MLKIGISSCFYHPDVNRPVFKGKVLLYIEESLAHWVQSLNALPFPIPTVNPNSSLHIRDMVGELDGLILHGGVDLAPQTYGETALKPEWAGDYRRDTYEIELLREFLAKNKPVLGICRGLQIINVAFGGTLYQDISSQIPGSLIHRSWELYDHNFHTIQFVSHSRLQKIFEGIPTAKVNSIHHQAVKTLGKGLKIEAYSEKDQIIEAVRLDSDSSYVAAIQWHPEFHDINDLTLLDCAPILEDYLDEVRKRKETKHVSNY